MYLKENIYSFYSSHVAREDGTFYRVVFYGKKEKEDNKKVHLTYIIFSHLHF